MNCTGIDDQWSRQLVENVTDLSFPVSSGDVIPVKCVSGYEKFSGPDTVTCDQDTTYIGLENITCTKWSKFTKNATQTEVNLKHIASHFLRFERFALKGNPCF